MTNIEAWMNLLDENTKNTLHTCLELTHDMREQGLTIYPPENLVLNALDKTAPQDTKCVILGQDPYHGVGQAMGLSFSVPEGITIPPSLRNILKELGQTNIKSGDLTPWTKQGVLLLNASLTVEAHKPNSHANLGWQEVTSAIVSATLDLPQPIIYLIWGKFAKNVIENALATKHRKLHHKRAIITSHPSPYSADKPVSGGVPFLGSHCFELANQKLIEEGSTPINWTLMQGD